MSAPTLDCVACRGRGADCFARRLWYKNMKGYVYILEDSEQKFYIGSTDNVERRLKQHNSGHTQTTRRMGILNLVFSQEFDTLREARKVEFRLKRLKRKDYIKRIVDDGYIKIRPA